MELTKLFMIYLFIIVLIYMYKPHLFRFTDLTEEERRRKTIVLLTFFIIIAIFVFYMKIFFEYYMPSLELKD